MSTHLVDKHTATAHTSAFTASPNTQSIVANLWHVKLGHPSSSILQNILQSLHLPLKMSSIKFCEACKLGKHHQLPFPISKTVYTKPFELIHTDLWGPAPMISSTGHRYYVSFIDSYSRYTWWFPLKLKSDTLNVFLQFNKFVKVQFGASIKAIQSDMGGEFISLAKHLTSMGIHYRMSCPYSHQQNGVAERKHRHIVEIGLSLLARARMPLKFWSEAFSTAVILINNLPTPSLNLKSPYETLYHKKPNYQYFKVFGSACYPYLRPFHSHKLDFHTFKCVFIGYSLHHKGYKCLHSSGRIYLSRHVIFHEHDLPYQSLFSSSQSVHIPPSSSLPISFLHSISPTVICSTTPSSVPSSASQYYHNHYVSASSSASPTAPPSVSVSPSTAPSSNNSPTIPQPAPIPSNTHPMITRSKLGIFKPKSYSASCSPICCLSESEPRSVKAAIQHSHWLAAMKVEYNALLQNRTWSLVPCNPSMRVVGNKWIFRIKHNPDGSVLKYKARLVAKGFHQSQGIDFFDTYSPVIKSSTIRIAFSLAASYGWDIQQVDINNAFLNGELDEMVFMHQPEGFISNDHPHHVCRLHKALYGLKQAPRAWFHKLKHALLGWGFTNATSDVSLFIKHVNSNVLFLLVYVDDILITGSSPALTSRTIAELQSVFALKVLGSVDYFLGFEASRSSAGIYLTQSKYISDLLLKTQLQHSKPCSTPLSPSTVLSLHVGAPFSDPTLYRSTIGALQYLTHTRPDIAFSVNKLSQFLSSPTDVHWVACKRILRYLMGTMHLGLPFNSSSNLTISAYSDVDWGSSLDDRRSTSGMCVYLGSNLISWSSRK
ncbi:hypothetical protein ACOSQ3_031039 [Xanthoceras sorbifolium]